MPDALLRHWHLLQAIPRAPAKRDVTTLHRLLGQAGYHITRRQLQRDLNSLSSIFAIRSDERGSGQASGWCWSRQASVMDLPAMDGPSALMLRLIERFIPQLLPPVLSDRLGPYFKKAHQVLKAHRVGGMPRWADGVRVVPREMPLLPPRFDPVATRVVYEALLGGKHFTARYTSRLASESREYEINPLGLVVRGNLIYLVCTLWGYQDTRQLALHRLTGARLLDKVTTRPAGFDLDEYIKTGEFHYPVGPMIQLQAIFDRGAAAHLFETPLSKDQAIEDVDEERVVLTATVQDTQQLEWWLLGFGSRAEIKRPYDLRARIGEHHRRAANWYR